MTLRAKVTKHRGTGLWMVELRLKDAPFGYRLFLRWEQALTWAIWRLKPTVTESFGRRWEAGRG